MAGVAGQEMKTVEQLKTTQITQYILNKEDLETILRTLIGEILSDHEAEKKEPRLTVKQVSHRLGVDPSTLWRWEREGYLTPSRIGRKVLYKESDIAAIEEGRI